MNLRAPGGSGGDVLNLENIHLGFGRISILDDLAITLRSGEIHALLGEHGAGKSSIAKIISGYITPMGGRIRVDSKSFSSLTLRQARRLGIRMVYQEFTLNNYFSVGENLFYADKRLPFISWRQRKILLERAREFVGAYGFSVDVKEKTRNLNLSNRTIVELLVNLTEEPKILILDESIEKISAADLPRVVDILRELRECGCSILIITHKIDSIYDLADRISIIRDGKVFYSEEVRCTDKIQLIKMAYTQMAEVDYKKDQYHTFYQLIKYNEAILVNLPVNLVVVDTYQTIQMLNRFCIESFRIDQDNYIGRKLKDLFRESSASTFNLIQNALNSFQENQFYQLELKVNGRDGIFNLRLFPVMDDGFIIGSILLLEDITEYILDRQKDFLSNNLASIGLLAASVAHEVNNPMEIVSSCLTNIKFKYSSRELLKTVGLIEDQLNSITHIIGNLQNFSMNERTSADEIEINALIREVIGLLLPQLKSRGITAGLDTHKSDYFILISPGELKQVFLNLFKNSMEAMPHGGSIRIRTSKIFAGTRNNLKIVFQDSGPGIEGNRNLFAPFYTTKETDRSNSGLGLSICCSIINRYNGSITLNNAEPHGCEVIIVLPLLED